ncbi:hypothetical protein MAL1_00066 [Bacteriophage DSS3_MAL1]|nr:hypothetical protein MAL1_00066 [Bacteriophage DSS3_MAL1]
MYVRVYAPNGEPFDVTRERADRLILQDGWTQSAPISVEVPVEPSVEEVEEAPVEKKARSPRGRKPTRARKTAEE